MCNVFLKYQHVYVSTENTVDAHVPRLELLWVAWSQLCYASCYEQYRVHLFLIYPLNTHIVIFSGAHNKTHKVFKSTIWKF